MTINSTLKRSAVSSTEDPSSKRPRVDESDHASGSVQGDTTTPSQEYRTQESIYVPAHSSSPWANSATPVFTAQLPADASVDASQPATTAQAPLDAEPAFVPLQDAYKSLAFIPQNYTARAPTQPLPGAVIIHLANRLGRLLDGRSGFNSPVHQLKVAGTLEATAMYADLLGQPEMKALLKSIPESDMEKLCVLKEHMTQLGWRLCAPSNEAQPPVQAPDHAAILESHHTSISQSDPGSLQRRKVHALVAFLESCVPASLYRTLRRDCNDCLAGTGHLLNVSHELEKAITGNSSGASPSTHQAAVPQKPLDARDDVRRHLAIVRDQLQEACSSQESAQHAWDLANWLQQRDQPESRLAPPLQALLQACLRCRASNGSAAAVKAMGNALDLCVSDISAAQGLQEVGAAAAGVQDDPALRPLDLGNVDQMANYYADLIEVPNCSRERAVLVIKSFIENPATTASAVSTALQIGLTVITDVRSGLRELVACNVPDQNMRDLVSKAIRSEDINHYRRSVTGLVRDRLINPQARRTWLEMGRNYEARHPDSAQEFFKLVAKGDRSLLQFINRDDVFAGVVYAHLFEDDDNYLKPVGLAYGDFLRACAEDDKQRALGNAATVQAGSSEAEV